MDMRLRGENAQRRQAHLYRTYSEGRVDPPGLPVLGNSLRPGRSGHQKDEEHGRGNDADRFPHDPDIRVDHQQGRRGGACQGERHVERPDGRPCAAYNVREGACFPQGDVEDLLSDMGGPLYLPGTDVPEHGRWRDRGGALRTGSGRSALPEPGGDRRDVHRRSARGGRGHHCQ